jgi:site-specific DNA recombinase
MTSAGLRRQEDKAPVLATARAALYLRVSTGRRAESDLSIPDQRRQIESYCLSRGWEVAAEFVEPGNAATDDRRPEAAFASNLSVPPDSLVGRCAQCVTKYDRSGSLHPQPV